MKPRVYLLVVTKIHCGKGAAVPYNANEVNMCVWESERKERSLRYALFCEGVMCSPSHVTRHTSHVTRHTSHVTRHTSHTPGIKP